MKTKPTPAPTKPTADEIQRRLGCTRRHAKRLEAGGSITSGILDDRERYAKARADLIETEADAAKTALAVRRGDLVSKTKVAEDLREIIEQTKAAVVFECGDQLAVENAGLSAEAQRKNNAAAIARAMRSLNEWAAKKLAGQTKTPEN